ncbi:MAG: ABC transporter permease [Anaerolineae bacterium]|nr:ABC transporter permease [Anaerolineae bacterium]
MTHMNASAGSGGSYGANGVLQLPRTEEKYISRSLWAEALQRILRDRLTLVALLLLLVMTLACIFAPPIVERELGVSAEHTDIINRYKPPDWEHNVLGTDHLGRDQLVRLLYGGRVSLGVAYGASLMSISLGLVIGMLAGYFGGMIDALVTWFITTISSIPSIFLLILVSVAFTPSPTVLIVLLGLLGWIGTCRLVRGEVLALKQREFITAAQAIGASSPRVLTAHLFPNLVSLMIVSLTIDAGSLILVEAGLSYLGLGVRPPKSSWGNMLTSARMYFNTGPHLVLWPGILIAVTVLCFFIAGDGLRDALDPRARGRGRK